MIQESKSGLNFNHKGFPLGIITDGDPLDRPDGSFAELTNMDYDLDTGEVRSRNSTVLSDLLDTLDIPDGYNIMAGGCKLFSFNDPVDREVCLVFVQDADNNVRIFVNTWFNPPAPNTDPVGSNNDYENYISDLPQGWQDEWIELTAYEQAEDFIITSPTTFACLGANLEHHVANYYRGWFAWNATKWNSGTSDQIKNESFACIESFNGSSNFSIQNRDSLNLSSWSSSDTVYLVRYPILIHKANNKTTGSIDLRLNFTVTGLNWIIKSNTSIECMIGQLGNLWFGFLNRDTAKKTTGYAQFFVNIHKYYGWWLDYAHPPVAPLITTFTNGGATYLDCIFGMRIKTEEESSAFSSTITILGLTLTYDFRQPYAVYKAINLSATVDRQWQLSTLNYHQYSRRITGTRRYGIEGATAQADPVGFEDMSDSPQFNSTSNDYRYIPVYSRFDSISTLRIADPILPDYPSDNVSLEAKVGYLLSEPPYIASTIGVFAQGRIFANNVEQADEIRYSLFQREDVLPLQNKRNIDSTDKDKNVAIDLLGVNPVIFKNSSIHIIGIEGASEAGWRLLDVKGTVGCPYPKSIARTPYGLVFANDSGIYLLTDTGEPINLLRNRRLREYLTLNKANIIGGWYSEHSEVWLYMGDNLFWICKLNKEEKQIGWKDYLFGFSGADWTIIDITNDEDNNFYIVTNKRLIRYQNDDEICSGDDADGNAIPISMTTNYDIVSSSKDKFHWIEGSLRYEVSDLEGRTQIFTILVYAENGVLLKVKNYNILRSGNMIFRNGLSNSQRAVKIVVAGTLTGTGLFKFQEVNVRVKPLTKPIKSGFAKVQ